MDTVRVSIGTEKVQWLPCEVYKHSIRKRCSLPVEFTESWSKGTGWHRLLKGSRSLNYGTKFSAWRWLVPSVYGHEGKAIYVDADQLCLGDFAELWRTELKPEAWFAAVVSAEGKIGENTPAELAVQTSVMLMDCARCRWDYDSLVKRVDRGTLEPTPGRKLDKHYANKAKTRRAYGILMQANWIDWQHIQEIDVSWNHMNTLNEGTKILHFTHSRSQCWKNPKQSKQNYGDAIPDAWFAELKAAVEDGAISKDDVEQEVSKGHVHKKCIEVL